MVHHLQFETDLNAAADPIATLAHFGTRLLSSLVKNLTSSWADEQMCDSMSVDLCQMTAMLPSHVPKCTSLCRDYGLWCSFADELQRITPAGCCVCYDDA